MPARPRRRRRRRAAVPVLAVAALLLVAGCATDAPLSSDPAPGSSDPTPSPAPTPPTSDPDPDVPPLHPEIDGWDATVVTLRGRDATARVDARVATTPEQLRRGLMHVPELPEGAGMLFVFSAERTGGFWMKDTLVPLDIAFADPDGTILAVLTMAPCDADPCPVYDPGVPYGMALEVPAGWFGRNGIDLGDRLVVGE